MKLYIITLDGSGDITIIMEIQVVAIATNTILATNETEVLLMDVVAERMGIAQAVCAAMEHVKVN